jgi:non-heme chloroperoxidase
MPFATAGDGAEIYYEEYRSQQEGDLLLLVHGSLGDYRDWSNQISFFQDAGFRVVTFSRRNHYPNKWKDYPQNYSLLTERDDIVSLLKTIGGQPADIVGHSYGGFATVLVAIDFPQYVRKIVLAEPPIFTIIRPTDAENISLALEFLGKTIDPAREFLKKGDFESGLKVFLDGITGERGLYGRLKPPLRDIMLNNARTALSEIEITPERDPFDCEDAMQISVPTLLVKGDESPKILQSVITELSKCIEKSKVESITQSSHGVIWEKPNLFNETVLRFLKG